MMRSPHPGLLVLSMMLLTSCAVFKPPARDLADSPHVPEEFSTADTALSVTNRWWERFGSPELDRLVETALADNLDLAEAYARLKQARARAVQAGASRWPDVGLEGGASHSERRHKAESGDFVTTDTDSYSIGLASRFELDVWGKNRSSYEAGRLVSEASQEDLDAAAVTLAAEVTLRWLDIVLQRQILDLLALQLEANNKVLQLTELRLRKSQATALDVLQQRDAVARIRALIPPEVAREQALRHELALLLGKPARTDLEITTRELPAPTPLPSTGLPVELLTRRPDLRASALRMQAADWNVSAARADRLPSIRLLASGGFNAEAFSDLLDSNVSQLAADLVGPLLDGGARKAEVERTRAVVEEQVAAYYGQVLQAIREVEDALVGEQQQALLMEALRHRLETVHSTYTESLARYMKGMNDFLPVLAAQSAEQETQRVLVRTQRDGLAYRVQLHRALAGDWVEDWNYQGPQGEK
jgi:NodT family efflux transporter outer membrane factor (OMF) lipoprotein